MENLLKLDMLKLKEIVIDVLSKVEEFSNSDEKDESKPIVELFFSTEGKRYADQVQDLREFNIKGIMMTVFNAISSYYPKILHHPEFIEMIENAELDQEERTFFKSIMTLLDKTDFQESFDNAQIFTVDDQRRFIGGFIFGLYSYCEVFVDSIVDRVFNISNFGLEYINYLEKKRSKIEKLTFSKEELESYNTDSINFASVKGKKLFLQHVKRNPFDKQNTILSVFDIKDSLNGIFHELDVKNYLEEFHSFKLVRDRIAHGDPDPSLSTFNSDNIKSRMEEISESWNQASEDLLIDPKREKLAYTITKMAEEIIKPLIEPFAIIQELTEAAIVITAIIERFLFLKEFNEVKNSNKVLM